MTSRSQGPSEPSATATETYRGPRPASRRPREGPLGRGDQLGRYVVLDQVGAGGMGVVYAAYDPELNRRVALKVLQPEAESSEHGEEARRRLLREAQALARVVHPNVVTIHDVGSVGTRVFLAMEYVDGHDLTAALAAAAEEGGDGVAGAVRLFLDAGRGLAAVHAAGLAHRDFKPSNVRVGSDGRVRVLDFGLALYAGDPPAPSDEDPVLPVGEGSDSALLESPLTRAGETFGTPRYMAPEQLLGQRADAKSDQFAFSVALFEALYGRHPFDAAGVRERVRLVRRGLEGPPPGAEGRLAQRLFPVVARGLAFDPDERHPDLPALLDELEAAAFGATRRWRPWAAAALAAAVAAGLAWQLTRTPPCLGAESRLDGVWDAERRGAVAAAFDAAPGLGAGAWRGAAGVLDRYADAWSAAYRDACEATHVRHEQSSELLDLRMGCLEDRRRELRALTGLFLDPTPELIGEAGRAASRLSPLAPCSDAERLLAPVPPPAGDPVTAERLESVRAALATTRALRAAGRPADALEGLEEPLALAAEVDYPPLEAEARLEEAGLLVELGDYPRAVDAFGAAVSLADEGHHDDVRARALMGLVWAEKSRGRAEAAATWSRLARAAIRRLGDQPDLLMRWHQTAAQVALATFDAETALERASAAVELSRRVLGPEHLHTGVYLAAVASAHSIAFRFDEALEVARQAAEIQRRVLGERHPALGRIERNMALQEIMLGRLEAARRRLLGCLEKARDVHDDHLVSVYLDLGITEARLGLGAEAEEHLGAALELARALHGDSSRRVAEVHNYFADAALELGEPEKARRHARRALDLLADAPPQSMEKVAPTLNLALAEARLGDSSAAGRRLEIARAVLGPDAYWIWVVDRVGGLVALGEGRPERAAERLGASLERLEASPASSPLDVHAVRLDLARALAAAGEVEKARLEATRCQDFFADRGRSGERGLRQSLTLLAELDAS